jgi:flagellar hook-associated protein 2
MGTVGINFGSATSGTGFDVATTVTAILADQQAIETPWKTQLSTLSAQDTVFTQLGTDLSTLTTSLQSLTDAEGVLAEKQGSSSDTNVLALTSASSSAVAGSHTIVVNSLASTASNYSTEIANASDTLTGGITVNGTTLNVVAGTSDTLATFASAINQASLGVTASVITDANGSRLSLVSNTSGAAGSLTISSTLQDGTTAIGFTQAQAGANASLTVDGLQISSASNTVTGAIPGVTFQLLSAAPAENVQIEVTNDNSAIETAVNSFVTAYNAVIADINGQEKNDSSGNPEPLFGSPTLSLIQTQLQGALFGGAASGTIKNIAQLGLSVGDDGTLTFTSSTLDSALNSNFSDVQGFLQNTGSFGENFSNVLNGTTSNGTTLNGGLGSTAPYGAVYLAEQQNSTQESELNADISNEQATLATEQTTLTAELNTANQELQAIPEQLNEINEIYSAVSGYNQNTGS